MALAKFRGGGSLDGWVTQMPDTARAVVTRRGSTYMVSDAGAVWEFAGFIGGEEGTAEMPGQDREQTAQEREAIAEALRPKSCGACGRTFGSQNAYQVHRDERWPGGCLPGDALGQLVEVDGVWFTRASAPR